MNNTIAKRSRLRLSEMRESSAVPSVGKRRCSWRSRHGRASCSTRGVANGASRDRPTRTLPHPDAAPSKASTVIKSTTITIKSENHKDRNRLGWKCPSRTIKKHNNIKIRSMVVWLLDVIASTSSSSNLSHPSNLLWLLVARISPLIIWLIWCTQMIKVWWIIASTLALLLTLRGAKSPEQSQVKLESRLLSVRIRRKSGKD